MPKPPRHQINPEKLLLSKWTAVVPRDRQKHFMVIRLIRPEGPQGPVAFIELEAVLTRRVYTLPWTVLKDAQLWRQGWDH